MIGHGFIGLLQVADYTKPLMRTTGASPGTVAETADGYSLAGFADTAFAWLDAPKSVGKWYWEATMSDQLWLGVTEDASTPVQYAGYYANKNAGVYTGSPAAWVNTAWTGRSASWSAGSSPDTGAVLGFALDLDSATKSLKMYVNNALTGLISWTSGPTVLWPMFAFQFANVTQVNLGPAGCAYDAPAGYAYL